MPNVYAAVFDSHVVKFGRSKNPHKRIGEHVTNAKAHGATLTDVLLSCVSNDVRDEELLLSAADDLLERISRESFKFRTLEQVGAVFTEARLPFIICGVSWNPYKLIIDAKSFDENLDGRSLGSPAEKLSKIEGKILDFIRSKGGEGRHGDISRSIPEASSAKVDRYISAMVASGRLLKRRHPDRFLGNIYQHNLYRIAGE